MPACGENLSNIRVRGWEAITFWRTGTSWRFISNEESFQKLYMSIFPVFAMNRIAVILLTVLLVLTIDAKTREFPITTNHSDQRLPAIYGDIVV